MSWLFASGGRSIAVSASPPILPMNIWGLFPLGLTGFISLQSKRFSRFFSNTTGCEVNIKKTKKMIVLLGEGNGNPLQYSCLEYPMGRGAWWAAVHGVVKSQTWLSDFNFTFHFHALEKEMATHSSVLAWRIPGTAEPGGLPSMESHRIRHDWSDLAAAAAMDTQKWNLRDNTTVHEKMLNITSLREMQLKPQWEIFASRWQSRKTLNSPPPVGTPTLQLLMRKQKIPTRKIFYS